ncbi:MULTISPECIES: hypothetical protein [unclassified Gordonia (in: high G+C Gram-positive bacteria)]
MESSNVAVDADEVAEVIAFYRRASHVLTAATDDLTAHDFGAWSSSGCGDLPDHAVADNLGVRVGEMGRALAQGLAAQAASAARLADILAHGLATLADADAEAARVVAASADPEPAS